MHMILAYASNEGYAEPAYISMLSVFENNKQTDEITIYYVHDNFQEKTKQIFYDLAERYNRKIIFLEPTNENALIKIRPTHLHITTFYRLFLSSILPVDVNRIIYLDCDTVIVGSLEPLFQTPLGNSLLAAAQMYEYTYKRRILGLDDSMRWMNAGIFVTDLEKWREIEIEKTFLDILQKHNWYIHSNDEGVLNSVVKGNFVLLHSRYNGFPKAFTNERTMRKISRGFHGMPFPSAAEYREAWDNPVILHFAGGNYGRPWMEGSIAPKKEIYLYYRSMTPWKDCPLFPVFKPKKRYVFYEWVLKQSPFLFDSMHSYILPPLAKLKKKVIKFTGSGPRENS